VHKALEGCFTRWDVRRMYCDPAWWAEEMQSWVNRFGSPPVMEYPNTPARMVPAASDFYAAVMERRLSHDGDATLARHLRNAVTRESANGSGAFIAKGKSSQKVDAAVAAVMAYAALVDETAQSDVEVQVMFV
jgi:phage terminase large subunit-like protein